MLKRDPNGQFKYYEVGFFKKRRLYRFYSGKSQTEHGLEEDVYQSLIAQQKNIPVVVMRDTTSKKRWWMFLNEFYWEDENYTAEEIRILILDKIEQKDKRLKRAMARLGQSNSLNTRRESIPDDVKLFVWQRDNGRCVKCGSEQKLEFDHIIPVAKGGSNTARNLQILCEDCNRSKGANIS